MEIDRAATARVFDLSVDSDDAAFTTALEESREANADNHELRMGCIAIVIENHERELAQPKQVVKTEEIKSGETKPMKKASTAVATGMNHARTQIFMRLSDLATGLDKDVDELNEKDLDGLSDDTFKNTVAFLRRKLKLQNDDDTKKLVQDLFRSASTKRAPAEGTKDAANWTEEDEKIRLLTPAFFRRILLAMWPQDEIPTVKMSAPPCPNLANAGKVWERSGIKTEEAKTIMDEAEDFCNNHSQNNQRPAVALLKSLFIHAGSTSANAEELAKNLVSVKKRPGQNEQLGPKLYNEHRGKKFRKIAAQVAADRMPDIPSFVPPTGHDEAAEAEEEK